MTKDMEPMDEYNWEEVDKDLWERAYESDHGHILYIQDLYPVTNTDQSELDDFNIPRYSLRARAPHVPDDRVLHESYDLEEVEGYLEYLVDDTEDQEDEGPWFDPSVGSF